MSCDKYEFMGRTELLKEVRRLNTENLKLGKLVKLSEQMLAEKEEDENIKRKRKRKG